MLGKGLESLIPPQNPNRDGYGGTPQGGDEVPNNSGAQVLNSDDRAAAERADIDIRPQFAGPEGKAWPSYGVNDDFRAAIYSKPPEEIPQPRPKEKVQEDAIFHIEVAKIKPNPNQPRRNFDEQGLWDLAHSIREFGFLQPLVVSKIEKETTSGVDVEYQLIAGERRLMASKLLGLTAVPAIVRNVDLEQEKLELAVVENIQREDLNPIEKARALSRLQDEFRLTQREIASRLGKSREAVANSVRLLDLPPYIQEALQKNQITESHGRFLLAIKDPGAQRKLFDDVVGKNLTTKELKSRVRAARGHPPEKEELPPELKMMEEKLSSELGTPVKIEKDKITITFYSEEELENIVRRIGNDGV